MASTPQPGTRPPLPPRLSSNMPPFVTMSSNHPYSIPLGSPNIADPRSSSTQSLKPAENRSEERRKLLLIYIHGFMGTETSFKSFPAHVHNLVTITLADTHIVHTKVYPRYRSRRSVSEVAEDFSRWLAPHESVDNDVVLVTHSMGGLVAAEVCLLSAVTPSPGKTYRHRILGTLNLDVPFLGMHPSVVGTGLASVFRPSEKPRGKKSSNQKLEDSRSDGTATPSFEPSSSSSTVTLESQSTKLTPQSTASGGPPRHDTLFSHPADPNFNPNFTNDVNLQFRKGWRNTLHFINKHSDGLREATKQVVRSHVEFGGAMADYKGLRLRYMKIRALDDEDATVRRRLAQQAITPARIRFVNYFTVTTGRTKPSKSKSRSRSRSGERSRDVESIPESETRSLNVSVAEQKSRSRSPSPRISIDEQVGDELHHVADIEPDLSPLDEVHPEPISSSSESDTSEDAPLSAESSIASPIESILPPNFHVQMPNLPPLPPPPMEPMKPNLDLYADKDAKKIVQKDYDRQIKAFKRAIRDHETAMKDREKLEEKLRKDAARAILKQRKAEEKASGKTERKGKNKLDIDSSIEPGKPSQEGDTLSRRSTAQDTLCTPASRDPASPSSSPYPNHPATAQPSTLSLQATTSTSDPSISTSLSQSTTAPTSITSTLDPQSSTKDQKRDKDKKMKKDQGKDKPPKERHFCILPQPIDGERDPLWVKVWMQDMDEVEAHTSLFIPGERYEELVGDVGERVEEWVRSM